jgi:hypothetical protein
MIEQAETHVNIYDQRSAYHCVMKLEEAKQIIKDYERSTNTTFHCRKTTKDFGNQGIRNPVIYVMFKGGGGGEAGILIITFGGGLFYFSVECNRMELRVKWNRMECKDI